MSLKIKEEGGFQYIDEGKGEILLLLHGLFGALSNWGGSSRLFLQAIPGGDPHVAYL